MADPPEWIWPTGDAKVEPTEHICFYVNGRMVCELTMLKDNAGSYVRLADMELPAGKYEFSFASMTDAEFYDEVRNGRQQA